MALDMFIDFAAGGAPVNAPSSLGPVQGESLDQTYPNTIQISSFAFGVQNATTIGSTSGGAGQGKAQFQALKFIKNVDKASVGLFTVLATGSHFKDVKLYVRVAGTRTAYLVYEFALVYITQIQSVNSDAAVQEDVQAIFGAAQLSYAQQQPSGQLSSPQTASWNQVTNSAPITIPGN